MIDLDRKAVFGNTQDDLLLTTFQQREIIEEPPRIYSDDPNLLGGTIADLRAELGLQEPLNYRFRHGEGGDSDIIDGPHEYAINKFNNDYCQPYSMGYPCLQSGFYQSGTGSNVRVPYSTLSGRGPRYPQNLQMNMYQNTRGRPYPVPTQSQEVSYPPMAGSYPVHYPNHHSNEVMNTGNADSTSWISNSSNTNLHIEKTPSNYYPYPNSYLPQVQEHLKWQEAESWEMATAADSCKKKMAAQLKIKNMIEQKSSRVVHVKGLEDESISTEIVASLFSNFGNIGRLLFFKKKQTALVEYHDQDSASVAKEMLNNLTFFGGQLKVSYSNYSSIEENLMSSNNPDKCKDVFVPNPKSYRFKDYKKISINPPSKVLHLSNISKEIYTEKDIADVFAPLGKVRKVSLLPAAEEEKCMALIELSTLEDALTCISSLHNRLIFSRYPFLTQEP